MNDQPAAETPEPHHLPLYARINNRDVYLGEITMAARDGSRLNDDSLAETLRAAADTIQAEADRRREHRTRHQQLVRNLLKTGPREITIPEPLATGSADAFAVQAEPPRARLEILELPAADDHDGPPPFALVLSGYDGPIDDEHLQGMKQFAENCGSRAFLVTPTPVEVW